jgi:hypothetical protein
MASIAGASTLYIHRGTTVLVPDSSGIPELLDPQPLMLCAAYVGQDLLDTQLPRAQAELTSPHCHLFVPLTSPDGLPYRSGIILTFQGEISGVSWRDERTDRHGAQMRRFSATTPLGPWEWTQDARQGRPGYFVTGQSAQAAVWRVYRIEADAFSRQIFTLAPVQFAPSYPGASFSSVADAARRAEITAQYDELCQSVAAGAYRNVLTKARNIAEALVAARLSEQGHTAGRDLAADLRTVRGLLDGPTRATCGWSDLEYHLSHKVRLLHAQTHIGTVTDTRRPIRPEFALTVAEDLAELLRIWGYAASS